VGRNKWTENKNQEIIMYKLQRNTCLTGVFDLKREASGYQD
jgi:hypothetical protein